MAGACCLLFKQATVLDQRRGVRGGFNGQLKADTAADGRTVVNRTHLPYLHRRG